MGFQLAQTPIQPSVGNCSASYFPPAAFRNRSSIRCYPWQDQCACWLSSVRQFPNPCLDATVWCDRELASASQAWQRSNTQNLPLLGWASKIRSSSSTRSWSPAYYTRIGCHVAFLLHNASSFQNPPPTRSWSSHGGLAPGRIQTSSWHGIMFLGMIVHSCVSA